MYSISLLSYHYLPCPRVLLQSDFFALELVSGHLYLHLGLGREPLKFRASRHSNQLANGEWHKVNRAQ